jgi:hypothetical protein
MITQPELFPRTSGFKPSPSLQEPRLWVAELRVFQTLAPGDINLLRKIALKPGLNILWAKPRARLADGVGFAPGVSGHGTGKTTFCRFIRYILGESTFGNDDQRSRLRDKFPEGWVVGEVWLDGTPWLVCRPFKVGPASYAYRNRRMTDLFAGDEGKSTMDDYRAELTRILVEPLPVATFATSPTPIEWGHLLQWLTRDQECRFSGLAELRHPTSESHAPDMMAEDRHFLFRAVLGLIDTAEQSELETNKKLLRKKQDAERDEPLLRYRSDSIYKRIHDKLTDYRTDLEGSAWLDAVATDWDSRAHATAAQLNHLESSPEQKTALDAAVIARSAVSVLERQKRGLESQIGYFEQQIKMYRGEQSEADVATWVKAHTQDVDHHDDLLCGNTLAAAIEHMCPLVADRKLPIERPQITLDTRPLVEQIGANIARAEADKARVRAQLTRLETSLDEQRRNLGAANAKLAEETAKQEQRRGTLALQLAAERALADEARRAHTDRVEADNLDGSLAELDLNIRKSQERQAAIREQKTAALSALSDTFGRVARAILDEEVKGEIRFKGRKINPTLANEIDLTSAALETLKIICFDLAALVSGVEGRGKHPRFLLHDGPREADMDASIYRNIFTLAHALEMAAGEGPVAFQYIVTTTEPPPDQLARTPWLLDPLLDASSRGGKLLAENF